MQRKRYRSLVQTSEQKEHCERIAANEVLTFVMTAGGSVHKTTQEVLKHSKTKSQSNRYLNKLSLVNCWKAERITFLLSQLVSGDEGGEIRMIQLVI